MSGKIKRIVIGVFKDNLTGAYETEGDEMKACEALETAIEKACAEHDIETDSIDFHTR